MKSWGGGAPSGRNPATALTDHRSNGRPVHRRSGRLRVLGVFILFIETAVDL